MRLRKMNKKIEESHEKEEEQNGTSRYGEFIPSYFYWITQEQQKRKADRLGSITDPEKGRDKKK